MTKNELSALLYEACRNSQLTCALLMVAMPELRESYKHKARLLLEATKNFESQIEKMGNVTSEDVMARNEYIIGISISLRNLTNAELKEIDEKLRNGDTI